MIHHVRTIPEQKVKSMLVQEVDPRKALLTLDLELIEQVTATDQEKRSDLHFVQLLNHYMDYVYYFLPVCVHIHVHTCTCCSTACKTFFVGSNVPSAYILFSQ